MNYVRHNDRRVRGSRSLLPGSTLAIGLLMVLFCPPIAAQQQGLSPEEIAELRRMELPTDPGELLAIVGDVPILLGEIMPKVDEAIANNLKVDLSEVPADELKIVRLKLMRRFLAETIQIKMLGYAFVMDKVGASSLEQRRDAQEQIETQARTTFYDKQLPNMMKQLKVDSHQQLDVLLRERGTSLQMMEMEFMDQMLRAAFVEQLVPSDPDVTLNEILLYYNAHRTEFETMAKARWEQLTVLFSNFPTREAAFEAISEMGNEVYFGGNVQKVAREKSQEPLADQGGVHDWTRRGSLASKPLDEQIFTLPLNRLSRIIEDESGLHIVRVLERKDAGITPLGEVQDEIRKILQDQKIEAAKDALLKKIRQEVPVYTRYPRDIEGSYPLHQTAATPPKRQAR